MSDSLAAIVAELRNCAAETYGRAHIAMLAAANTLESIERRRAGAVHVPREPTEDMLHAGMASVHVEDENGMIGPAFYPLHIYRAMIAAALQAGEGTGEGL